MQPTQFSDADYERMRTLLAQRDSLAARESNSFDLNNPPRKPYLHQEYPRLVYMHDTRKHITVSDAGELQEALDAGWVKEPFQAHYDAPALSTADQAQVDHLDKLIVETKNKRRN